MTPTFSRALTVIALAMTALTARAVTVVSITVPDFSFEAPGGPVSSSNSPNSTLVSGWIFNAPGIGNNSGSAFGTTALLGNFSSNGVAAANGSYAAYLNHDTQQLAATITSAASLGIIQNQTIYSLTVAVGNFAASDTSGYGSPGEFSLSLLANGKAFATLDVPYGTTANPSIPNGTFEDFILLTKKGDSDLYAGENLTIQMTSSPFALGSLSEKIAFDNVVLTSELVPEPSTWTLLAAGLLPLGFLRQKRRA